MHRRIEAYYEHTSFILGHRVTVNWLDGKLHGVGTIIAMKGQHVNTPTLRKIICTIALDSKHLGKWNTKVPQENLALIISEADK